MLFNFRIIPHRQQRYPTCGDYFLRRKVWHFRVSRMSDHRYSWLVFLHEIIEWAICRLQGIKVRDIDNFDVAYETTRPADLTPCGCRHYDEPGSDPHAPYHLAHQVATDCEKSIAHAIGVRWSVYSDELERL